MRNTYSYFKPFIAFLSVILPVCLSGCVQGKPQILQNDVKLLRVQGPAGLFSERLSLFVLTKDADGPEDFGSIVLSENESGLTWSILPDSIMVTMKGQDRWIGSNVLAEPGDAVFPEGSYTIVFNDLAGNETQKIFRLVRPSFPDFAPVKFYTEGTKWFLDRNASSGEFTRTWLFLLDGQARVLQSWKVPDSDTPRVEGTLESLQMMALQAVSIQCYTENIAGTAGVLLTPVDLR